MLTLAVAWLMVKIEENNGLWVICAIIGDCMIVGSICAIFYK
jgi:hypothetical protein